MPVYLKEINVQNLGPLNEFTFQPGRFNLIYGHNEKGKTYLVEFVIRSLFRNAKLWQLRNQTGSGKVIVEGLTNGGSVDFYPSSAKKLEDYWDESSKGLPPDFSKLLVVKGAELEIARVEGGADKAILKRFLTSKEILDKIDSRVSKTIQECQIENNIITGSRRGEIIARLELNEQLKTINKYFVQIDKGFSGGKQKQLTDELHKLQSQIERQLRAKKYLAYTVNQQLKQLREEKNKNSADKLQEIKSGLKSYQGKVTEYKKKKDDQYEAATKSQHFEWLKNAVEVYETILKREFEKPNPVYLILAGFMLGLAGLFAVLKMPIYSVAALAGIIVFGILHIRKYRILAEQAVENQEIENLKIEFKKHFQRELTGLPILKEYLQRMEEDYNRARYLKEELSEILKNLYSMKFNLSEQIKGLTGKSQDPKKWNDVLHNMEIKLQSLESQFRDKELYLAKLGVDPSDYVHESSEIEYSKQKLDELEHDLKIIQDQLEDESQKLTSLKQLICQQTGDNISTNWPTLLKNLQDKRESVLESYKQKTAEIVGKKIVHQVIAELRNAEDNKILSNLKSKAVLEPLYQMTHRYKRLDVDGDKLVVADPFNSFYLSEMSTGAQEQILLALRIGFSTQIANQDNLFLILDDAFQYSDWERRKLLTNKVVDLAQQGWQIIYFTMDDNIRALFDKKGSVFGKQYKSKELA